MAPTGEAYPGITYTVTENSWLEATTFQETLQETLTLKVTAVTV
jgi:hypothetical protein